MKAKILMMSLLALLVSFSAEANPFKVVLKTQKCPSGYTHATVRDVLQNKNAACNAPGMGKWYILRLAGKASLSGPGYRCAVKRRDTRKLGGALCKKKQPIAFKVVLKTQKCPSGYTHATMRDVLQNKTAACNAPGMGKWYILRLAGKASFSGPGYKCTVKRRDNRKLGGALCKKAKPLNFKIFLKTQKCPKGYRHATYREVKQNKAKACATRGMGKWFILRLAGKASFSGPGYKCTPMRRDNRKLGGALCVQMGGLVVTSPTGTTGGGSK